MLQNNKLNKTKPGNEYRCRARDQIFLFFFFFSTEFRRLVCLREKNLNSIEKRIH